MNDDPAVNLVVFEARTAEGVQQLVGKGPTTVEDCIQGVWRSLAASGLRPQDVLRIYSEWEASASDVAFLKAVFPHVRFSFSFSRPADPAGWPAAFAQARQVMEQAGDGKG